MKEKFEYKVKSRKLHGDNHFPSRGKKVQRGNMEALGSLEILELQD